MTGGLSDAGSCPNLGEVSRSLTGPYSECSIATQTKETLSAANAKDRQATWKCGIGIGCPVAVLKMRGSAYKLALYLRQS